MHTLLVKDSKATIRCSVPSAPVHLHSSKAFAPLSPPLDYEDPGLLTFNEKVSVITH